MSASMLTQLVIEGLMIYIGFKWACKLFTVDNRRWGFFIAIAVFMLLKLKQSYFGTWSVDTALILTAYVAVGVGLKTMAKPDPSESGDGSVGGGEARQVHGEAAKDKGDAQEDKDEVPEDKDEVPEDKNGQGNNQN
jgi:hypothetical protein